MCDAGEKFIWAIKNGDLENVKAYLEAKVRPGYRLERSSNSIPSCHTR